MTGGQSTDLESEGRVLRAEELERMYALKTGALIHAAIMSACLLHPALPDTTGAAFDGFAREIGIAFQIRDDILDVEGATDVIGKPAGSDEQRAKATYPALFGLDASRKRCEVLLGNALASLDDAGVRAEALRWLAGYIVERGK